MTYGDLYRAAIYISDTPREAHEKARAVMNLLRGK